MPRFAPGATILLAGTKRGLFLFSSPDRRRWRSHGSILTGGEIYNAVLDQRGEKPRIFAADNHFVFGARVRYSDNWGRKWVDAKKPIRFETGESLKNVWVVQPGRASEPDVVYAGIDPASLWISRDRGKTWQPDQGILENPTRSQWQPGLGGLCLHSIVPHPTDPRKMWVAASAVGVLATDDGGVSWAFRNKDVPARHMPETFPEFGQCVHRLLSDPSNPERLVQQNHWGMFESLDGGRKWTDIQSNMPSAFGFPMGMDRSSPRTLYAIPDRRRNLVGANDQGSAQGKARAARSAPPRDGHRRQRSGRRVCGNRNRTALRESGSRRHLEGDRQLHAAHLLRQRRNDRLVVATIG